MTAFASPAQDVPSRTPHGILCVVTGMAIFVLQDSMMKSLIATYPVWLLIFVRGVVSTIVLTPLILILGGTHRIYSPLWKIHFIRALLLTIGFSLFYTAFPFMGLAEVTTIFFSGPLMTAVLAAIYLRERLGPHRIAALLAGFVGVVVAMNPTSDAFTAVSILPLISALLYAISQVLTRHVGERDSSLTVGLQTLAFSGLLILPIGWMVNQFFDFSAGDFQHLRLVFPGQWITDIPRLTLLGILGMAGYVLIGRAYQVASASLVAPFDYSYLPMATLLGYLAWAEVPSFNTIAGMTLIVFGGLYLGYREIRAARRKIVDPIVAEAVFAPGAPPPSQSNDRQDAP